MFTENKSTNKYFTKDNFSNSHFKVQTLNCKYILVIRGEFLYKYIYY